MTWLISQALMNSLSLQEQVEEYLAANFSDGEQSAPLSGNPIQQAYCAPDKMTVFSRLSRFGMMFKPLTDIPGEELLMSSVVDFHVRTLVRQEKAQELTESDQECGEKWRASFTKYDPDSSLWRTHQCSLLGDLEPFSETWPQWGLMRDGECWEQRMLEQTIRGTESGLSPNGVDSFHTPNTTGLDGGSNSRKALKKKMETWPTPTTKGYGHAAEGMVGNLIEKIEQGVITKQEAENMLSLPKLENHRTWKKKFLTPQAFDHRDKETWPTPRASDYKGATSAEAMSKAAARGFNPNLPEATAASVGGGKLNPTWVEWLMGWPLGWTDLKPLEMDKSPCALQPHGESSQEINP